MLETQLKSVEFEQRASNYISTEVVCFVFFWLSMLTTFYSQQCLKKLDQSFTSISHGELHYRLGVSSVKHSSKSGKV